MEEIIKQIAQIDSVAVSNRENSEQALKERRQNYEREMQTYREERLKKAKEQADRLYNEMVMNGEADHSLERDKSKRATEELQNRYAEIEKVLLNEVFDQLFGVEG